MHDRTRSAAFAVTKPLAPLTGVGLIGLEWQRLRRDRVFWIAVALACLALWYGLANGAAFMRFQEQTIARAAAIAAERLADAKAEASARDAAGKEIGTFDDPRAAVGFESRFLRAQDCLAPTPLAMVAVGQSDLLPTCIRAGIGPLAFFTASHEWENPLRLLLGRFDSVFAVVTLLPLLALAASFGLLAREKELGTLPLILSCPVPITRWLATAYLLRALVFIGLVLGALILGVGAVGFDVAVPGALLRLSLYAGVVAAYLGFWFALAFFLDSRGGSSASQALGLAGLWLVLVVLAPAALNLVVKSLYPLPSRIVFVDAVRRASDASAREASAVLADYFHDHPELSRGVTRRAEIGSRRLVVNTATEAAARPEQERFRRRNESQQVVIDGLRFLSPAIVFQQAADAISGNDASRHRSFVEAVEAHRAELRRFLAPYLVSDAPFTRFDAVPAFAYRDLSIRMVVKEALLGLLALLVPCALLIAGGIMGLRRPLLER